MRRVPVLSSAKAAMRRKLERIRARNHESQPLDADVHEHEDAFRVILDAPGVSREQVHVRFLDGTLITRIERYRQAYEGFDLRVAGRNLSLEGEVELPEEAEVDPSGAEATVRANGTLVVSVPKDSIDEEPDMTFNRAEANDVGRGSEE